MHVVADRPTIVSALPAPTSTCMRRKTHSACCGSAATPKYEFWSKEGPRPRPKTDGRRHA